MTIPDLNEDEVDNISPPFDDPESRQEAARLETNHRLILRSYHYLDMLAAYSEGRRTKSGGCRDFISWLKSYIK